ncbi:MAG: GMC family oxidoreductase [Deltaproteobacteria bacterium]|nr:GMC family oxidoreductase [Deltaproteobacteria bacterium]
MPPAFSGRTLNRFRLFAEVVLGPEPLREFSFNFDKFSTKLQFLYEHSSPQVRWFTRLTLWVFVWSSLWPYGLPFSRLSLERRTHHFLRWKKSRSYLRYVLLRLLQTFVHTAFYAEPGVGEKLGFKEVEGGGVAGAVHEPPLPVPSTIETEICVIGSGAGGAVVAKELAEKGKEVLILEEGGSFGQKDFQQLTTLERNRLIYRDGGITTTLGFPMILLPTGKCVGGTTLVNSGTCFRTPPAVLQKWGISPDDMARYFEKVEKTLQVETVQDSVLGQNDRLIMKGAASLGLHTQALARNAHACKGSGVCIFGCPTGAKQSMERSYLPLAYKAGARLISHCRVTKLVKKGGRVVSIEAIREGQKITIIPQKVVVACGTLHSPLLLERSGIGRESGQCGKNLSIHPTAKMAGLFESEVDGFRGVPQASMITDFEKEGLMFESVFFPPWLLATSLHLVREAHWEVMKNYRRIAIFGFLVHDESRGRVKEGKGGRPLVFYNLGSKEKEKFVRGLKILAEVFFAAGARKVFPTLRSVDAIHSVADIKKLDSRKIRARDFESAGFHPLGTCRMGNDPRLSVVDMNLRVHDMENLWVADGSVFPSSLGVNPQITIMAFATRCADAIST